MEILFNALSNAKKIQIGSRQAEIAKKLALNLKSKCHLKSVQFCKKCKIVALGSHQKYALVLNQSHNNNVILQSISEVISQ